MGILSFLLKFSSRFGRMLSQALALSTLDLVSYGHEDDVEDDGISFSGCDIEYVWCIVKTDVQIALLGAC